MVGFRYEGMGTSIFMVEIKWTKWFRWPAYRNLVLVHDVFERSSGLPDGVELAQSVTMESLPGQWAVVPGLDRIEEDLVGATEGLTGLFEC